MNKLYTAIIMVVVVAVIGVTMSEAGVDIHVGIGVPPVVVVPAPTPVVVAEPAPYAPPPEYEVSAPPPVVVIPGTYVYSIVDPRFEIFFYHGAWWRHHNGYWFTARDYNRSWVYVRPERVPMAVVKVPHDYRNRIRSSERIEYRDLSGNWERWEREKHWDRHEEHHNYSDRDDYGDRRDDRGRDHRW